MQTIRATNTSLKMEKLALRLIRVPDSKQLFRNQIIDTTSRLSYSLQFTQIKMATGSSML